MLHTQVRILTAVMALRQRITDLDRDERGDVYSSTIMIAVAVTIAIGVGAILLIKFTTKANNIDTDTPTVTSLVP